MKKSVTKNTNKKQINTEMKCFICKKDCARSNVKCIMCSHSYHVECAPDNIPNMTVAMVEFIRTSNGAIVFRCGRCISAPSTGISDDAGVNHVAAKLDSLEEKIEQISKLLSDNILPQLSSIKKDIENCVSRVEKFEKCTNEKMEKLMVENNFLRKQLNRGDILISGFPSTLSMNELYNAIHKVGAVFDVDLQPNDINHCTYVRNKKVVLVKFNSIRKRDELTAKYFKNKNLQLNQVLDTDIQSRLFINDHLTPIAANLQYICRKLQKDKKITKYYVKNTQMPEVKIVCADGSEKNVRYDEISNIITLIGGEADVVS